MHEMKRIRILADPYLFVLTLAAIIASCAALAFFLVMTSDVNSWTSKRDKVLGELLFFAMMLAPICISFFVDTRWANVLVLSHQKIELRSCFKKPVVYAYEEYPTSIGPPTGTVSWAHRTLALRSSIWCCHGEGCLLLRKRISIRYLLPQMSLRSSSAKAAISFFWRACRPN